MVHVNGRRDPRKSEAWVKSWQVSEAGARHLGLGPETVRSQVNARELVLRMGAGRVISAVRMPARMEKEQQQGQQMGQTGRHEDRLVAYRMGAQSKVQEGSAECRLHPGGGHLRKGQRAGCRGRGKQRYLGLWDSEDTFGQPVATTDA